MKSFVYYVIHCHMKLMNIESWFSVRELYIITLRFLTSFFHRTLCVCVQL